MTKDKESLIKTLKNESMRIETRKLTGTFNKTSRSFISETKPNISVDKLNRENLDVISNKKKKKRKSQSTKKKSENKIVVKAGEIEKGKKLKLLKYETLEDKEKEKNKEVNKENNESKKIDGVKPIIKDKENKNVKKNKKNILENLDKMQYNFDNLMSIGVHGTKVYNNKK